MITKEQIADLLIAQKSGGDASVQNKVDRREVYKYIDMVIGAAIGQEYERNVSRGTYQINGDWVSTYDDVPIYLSKKRDIKYAKLPAKIISLPGDRGLRTVCPQEDQESPFVIVEANSRAVFKNLEANYLSGKRECFIEGNRIYFPNLPVGCCSVMVKMVAGTDLLPEDAEIPIPAIYSFKAFNDISAMLEVQVRWKTKMINDSNPNTI